MQGKVDITTVGGRIKHLRTQAGLSQDELAELLNLENRASVSSYETNRRAVSGELALELAKVLGSSINFILEGEEPEDPLLDKLMQLWKSVESEDVKNMILAQVEKAVELDQKMRKEKDEENQYDSSCNS